MSLALSDIRPGRQIVLHNEPYEIMSAAHNKQARGGAIMKTKLRNLASDNVISHTFQGKDRVEEANLEETKAQYLYQENDQLHFMNEKTYEQFSLSQKQLGNKVNFLVDGTTINILNFNSEPITINLPIKITLQVTEAPPGIKGDTAQGGTKQVTLNTGHKASVPLFIKEGDKVIIDTRDGCYVARKDK